MVELDIKISAKDLYDYKLMHHYNTAAGVMGSALGAICILLALKSNQIVLLAAGVFLLLYLTWTLFIRSR